MSSHPESTLPPQPSPEDSVPIPIVRAISLSAVFKLLEAESSQHPVTIRRMLEHLAGRGYPAVIALFSIPAILPIIAFPMGVVLIFSGLRMALARKLWIPSRIQDYQLSQARMVDMVHRASAICLRVERYLKPRYKSLCLHPWSHQAHGLLIACIAVMLILPIPGTNWLYAIPILLIGLGLMENDGLMVAIGDIIGLLAVAATLVALLLSGKGIQQLFAVALL